MQRLFEGLRLFKNPIKSAALIQGRLLFEGGAFSTQSQWGQGTLCPPNIGVKS